MNSRERLRTGLQKAPFTILAIAIVGYLLASDGVRFHDVFGPHAGLFVPSSYTVNALFHSDWGHYWSNVRLLVPFGVVLTLLTSDRHVLGLVAFAHVVSSLLYAVGGGLAVGASGVVFAVFAGLVVRTTGDAMQNQPTKTLLAIEAGLLLPFTVVLYGLVIAVDFGQIAHMGHFMAFCWGALYELAFVGIGHERGERLLLQW